MRRVTQNERGVGLLDVLMAVLLLFVIAAFAVPQFTGNTEEGAAPPVEQATSETSTVSGSMAEDAAEMAYMSGFEKDAYTLKELVNAGYLSADLSDEQAAQQVARTGDGSFVFTE